MGSSDSKLSNLKSLIFLEMLENKYKKYKFIRRYRAKLNVDNPYKLSHLRRIWFDIEKNVFYKFLLTVLGIYLSMKMIGFSYNSFFGSFNLLTLDNNSARYFFSTVAQSLAALFAISFTVLLIYLQISTDKYSIQTVKFVFEGWRGIIVVTTFLITIVFSIYSLGNINNSLGTLPYSGSGVFVIFSLLVFCSISLIEFFYRTILNLIPENFIRDSGNRIRRTFVRSLDYIQVLRIKNRFKNRFINEHLENLNIEWQVFDEGEHPIKTAERGFVSDIDVLKLEKAGKLLSESPAEGKAKNKVVLTKYIESRLGAEKNILGYVEHPDENTREKISDLIRKAYKNDKRLYLLDYYQELIPLASLTTRAIKEREKGTVESALEEFTDIGIEYLKARKNFGLMLHPEQTDGIKYHRHFFAEWIGHVEKMLDEALKQDDNYIVEKIIRKILRVGNVAIEIQDSDAFEHLTGYFAYSYHRSLGYENLIGQNFALSYLWDWFIKLKSDIERKEVDQEHVKNSELFFVEMIRTNTRIVKLLIDKENNEFILKALDGLIAFLDSAHMRHDMHKYELVSKKRKISKGSEEYAEIENKLKVIELKEQIGKDLEKLISRKLFMLGAYVMVRQEENAVDVRFSSKVFKELSRKLEEKDLEKIFEHLDSFHFEKERFWFIPKRRGTQFIDTSYVPRFYLLICSYLVKNGRKLERIKPTDYFTENQIEEFEREFSKLLENIEMWDSIFGDDAKKYLEQVVDRLKECQKEQHEKIREKVRKAELAVERVEKVKNDIMQYAENSMKARAFVKVEEVPDAPEEDFSYVGIERRDDKIFFVEDVDKGVPNGYEDIGSQLGSEIGTDETNFIVEKIYTALNKTKNIVHISEFTFETIDKTVKKLEERGIRGRYVLLIGYGYIDKIWKLREFKSRGRSGEDNAPYGYIDDVEVYLIRTPDEKTAILLSQDIGTLFVKEKLIPEISVDFDKEKIIERKKKKKSLSKGEVEKLKEELEEKVNIKALERIKFDIENDEAGLILKFKTVT